MSAGLVLAGCGGDGGGDGSTVAGEGPLEEFFGEGVIDFQPGAGMGMSFGGGMEDFEVPQEELERMRELEELVADCMAEQGFEYTPNMTDPNDYVSPWVEAQSLPPDEFAEQYGYGISTMHYSEIEDELPPDPNQEYRESLSDEALQAYTEALTGNLMEWNPDDGPPPVEDRGCYGIASVEVYGEDPVEMFEEQPDPWSEFEGLMSDVGSLGRRIQEDPRLAEAEQGWLGCMADAGYPDLQRVGEAQETVYERLAEIEGWSMEIEAAESGEPLDGEGSEEATLLEPPEIDPAELKELQEYEIEVAVTDRECMAEHYDDVFAEVSVEFQEEFVEENRADLERYRTWAEENDFVGGFGFGG